MQGLRAKNAIQPGKIYYLRTDEIQPNPCQPRKIFDKASLEELAASISQHGVIQPLCVRRGEVGYQLVAGERRLRASKMAGLSTVPCLVLDINSQESSVLALIENLQRQDLDYIEEAEGLARLMGLYGLSQEEVAHRVGKSQSAVANKIRLLKHSPEVLLVLRENGLCERHARALLRLNTEGDKIKALKIIIENRMNVAKTEAMIEKMLKKTEENIPRGKYTYVIKDVRIFMNTIARSMELMKSSGVNASYEKVENEREINVNIRIPK